MIARRATRGRATSPICMTVTKRYDCAYRLIEGLHECVATTVKITVLTAREFDDQRHDGVLQLLQQSS